MTSSSASGLPPYPEKVLTEDLLRVRFLEAAAEHLRDEARESGHVGEAARHPDKAVPVGAERDVVDAGDGRDVLDVVDDRRDVREKVPREEPQEEDDADDAAALGDPPELLVG